MKTPSRPLTASEAARRLGVSTKALRLYEQHRLVTPGRTPAGYRIYGVDAMARASEVVALRALGLSLADAARVLGGDPQTLACALSAHENALDRDIRERLQRLERVRTLRAGLAAGKMPAAGELGHLIERAAPSVAFALPWPWGGEWFEMQDIRALNYLIGSLGSGKTRLAIHLAQALPNGIFLGLDRLTECRATLLGALSQDTAWQDRVDRAMAWLRDEGAHASDALTVLLASLTAERNGALVIDMIEQNLTQATQEALIRYLRQQARATRAHPLFIMTRSSAILDLTAVGPHEAILLCPANHSVPLRVAPYPGAPGFEAVATCLASPDVRERVAVAPPSSLTPRRGDSSEPLRADTA